MNKQQIFDTIVHSAINNPVKAIDNMGRCFYRGEEGTSCFIGKLIPNSTYKKSMEAKGVSHLCEEFPSLKPVVLPTDMEYSRGIKFMQDLQAIHDTEEIIFWGELLRKVAVKHKLLFMELY